MAAGMRRGIEVRAAAPADAADLAGLLAQLGYPVPPRQASERLGLLLRDPASAVLLAADHGPAVGLVALHWCATLHTDQPVARITALVVDDRERGRGIGRLLVKAGAQAARAAGCDILELTSAPGRTEAHAFYTSIGFVQDSLRFSRSLRRRNTAG